MEMEKRYEELVALFENSDTAAKLAGLSASEGVVYLKQNFNLDFTEDELRDFGNGIRAAAENNSEELDLDELDQVAGGGKSVGYQIGYYVGKIAKAVKLIGGIFTLFA